MKRVLPLAKSVNNSFAGYAALNNIALNYENGREWIVQNFIKLIIKYSEDYDSVSFDYFNADRLYLSSCCSFQPESYVNLPVKTYSIPTDQVESGTFVELLKKQINNGYYVITFLNWHYLKEFEYERDGFHEIFMYGYDDETQEVYATCFLPGKDYRETKYSYRELEESYQHMDVFREYGEHDFLNRDLNKITLLQYKKYFDFSFSVDAFLKDIKFYLNRTKMNFGMDIEIEIARNKSKRLTAYGNQFYDVLAEHVKNRCGAGKSINLTTPYALYNNMEGIMYKLKYLLEKGYVKQESVIDEYAAVMKAGKSFMFTSVKYIEMFVKGKHSDKLPDKMVSQLMRIKDLEENALGHLIELLEQK